MIQTAFAQVQSQFNLTASQKEFSQRLEHFAISEQLDSDLISAAFERSHNFRRKYGSVQLLSKRIFAGRLDRFSEALQNAIDQQKPQQEIPLTDEEKAFLQEDLAANLAKAPLAWDEIESLGYVFFEDGYLDNIFRVLSLEAELQELSLDASIVKAHQHSAGAKKGGQQV